MNFIFVLSFIIILVVGWICLWQFMRASPVFWQMNSFALIALGTAPMLDFDLDSDKVYALMQILAFLSFIVPAILLSINGHLKYQCNKYLIKDYEDETIEEMYLIYILFGSSIIVCVYYYYLIGYNMVTLIAVGGVDNYSDLRIGTYSGENYFAPGYVNQFKNVLLPICSICIGHHFYKKFPNFYAYIFCFILLIVNLFLILGTGQRAFLFYTICSMIFGYLLYNWHDNKFNGIGIFYPIIAIGTGIFIAMTFFYQGNEDSTFIDVVQTALSRFTGIQQEGGLIAFRYIFDLPVVWFSDWLQAIKGIVPGEEGSSLAHEVHGIMYGSTRGTVPATAVGSAYYNGGVIGVLLLYLSMGIIYTKLYIRLMQGRKSISRSMCYGFMFFYLAIYVSETPVILIDNGVLTLFLFIVFLNYARSMSIKRTRIAKKMIKK